MNSKFVFFLLMVSIFVASAPSDYVQLYSHTYFCGGLDGRCETVYNVTNPTDNSIMVDKDKFKLFFRRLGTDLQEIRDDLRDIRLEFNLGAGWTSINRYDFSYSFPPKTSILVKISAEKKWQEGENGEWYLPEIDNVLFAFGRNYTEYAWWNTSLNYKINITNYLENAIPTNATWIFNKNFSVEAEAGKVDHNGTCIRIVNYSEDGELPFEHEPANLSIVNYTAFIFQNFTTGNLNYTVWAYYGDGICGEGQGDANYYWNYTGASIVSHFGFDKVNGSSFYDSAGGDENFTIIGSLPIVKTPFGYGFQRSANGNYALTSGKKINGYAQGTAIIWANSSEVKNSELIARGNASSGGTFDFTFSISGGAPRCSLDATVNNAVGQAISADTWYMFVCTWNSTGVFIYKNGIMEGSDTVVTTGIPDNVFRTQLTIGQGIGFGNVFDGSITDVSFYNRSLSVDEIKLIYNSSRLLTSSETNYTADADLNPTITVNAYNEITNTQIYFNATFDNTTSTFSFPTTLTYSNGSGNFTQGSSTITFYNASYYSRKLIKTIQNQSQTITGYLLPINLGSAHSVIFRVINSVGSPISGATLTFKRSIGGTLTTVGACSTDTTGVCSIYLDLDASYTIVVSATGYADQTNTITPVGTEYTFTLSTTATITYDVSYANLTFSLLPFNLNLPQNWTIINYTVVSSDNALVLWGLNISYNGANIFNSANSSASGGTILVNVSTIEKEGNLTATSFFRKSGTTIFYYSQRYTIYANASVEAGSLENLMRDTRIGGKSPFLIGFLIILVVATIIGGLNSILAVGAGMGLITVLLLMFVSGFLLNIGVDAVEWGFMALLALLAAAIFKLRSGH